jgi:hypothetical protein
MTKFALFLCLTALPVAAIDIVASGGLNTTGQGSVNATSGTVTAGGRAVGLLNFGGNFLNLGAVALGMELPIMVGGAGWTQITSGSVSAESVNLAVIPGLRVRFLPVAPVTPWVSAGVGGGRLARSLAGTRIAGTLASSTTQSVFAWDAAAGLDFKPVTFLLFRAEVRNFHFQSPESLASGISKQGRNNLAFLVGIGVRF